MNKKLNARQAWQLRRSLANFRTSSPAVAREQRRFGAHMAVKVLVESSGIKPSKIYVLAGST
ncbi:hypothetical protein [Pseudoroseomonas ludipueritiae]|uniref:Transposase n=1 Tax=Pseudoroseomonas ludipueritiae TaxID=198093 RepID=A0ABR7R6I4_9PROT|nr:hypothetical protein [Pseudoroseomonas ludipueritiae]MBC9177356.1 hypothetical protein [Pseudoroseomonas ludipueritiae]MCG7359824.1 hypothetical protein [Roseomonas sp. ACRSG]